MTLLPFTVDVRQPTLDDLAERLAAPAGRGSWVVIPSLVG